MLLNCKEKIALSIHLEFQQKQQKKICLFYSQLISYAFISAEDGNSKTVFYCNLLSLLMQASIELTCFYGNKTDKVFQDTRVIDYTCTLCHIQLTQSDCTPHYATTCRKNQ